jgi:hypothetical protein
MVGGSHRQYVVLRPVASAECCIVHYVTGNVLCSTRLVFEPVFDVLISV